MERGKTITCSRTQKKIPGHLGSELFALGSKASRDDSKTKVLSIKSGSNGDRKRESSSTISNVTKKAKINISNSSLEIKSPHLSDSIEQMPIDHDAYESVNNIFCALELHDEETVLELLTSCIKHSTVQNSRLKGEYIIFLAVCYIAKIQPAIFNDAIISAIIFILRREPNNKTRKSTSSQILATNLLLRLYNERNVWPETFLRIFIEDAINDRFWIDNGLCYPFIKNICSAFHTSTPAHCLLQLDLAGITTSGQQHRDLPVPIEDDSLDNILNSSEVSLRLKENDLEWEAVLEIKDRFRDQDSIVEKCVTDAIKEQLNRRQQQDCYTRNFLKFLCCTSGLTEVRYLCMNRLELWIHNGKLVKHAQQLLSYICFNINALCPKDHEVLAMLVKMRLKTKPLINFYMICLKEMLRRRPDVLCIMLKIVVQNELSNTRNPNNMGMLATMFHTSPEKSAIFLAEIYKEFLLQRDDCLRTLRVFLRELVRMLRFDVNMGKFCKYFLNERADLTKQIEDSEFRDRVFHSMVDIICLCMLLTVSPQVRECNLSLRTSRDIKNNNIIIKFFDQMSEILLSAVSWMYEIVPNLFKLQSVDYNQALHKILLLENPEQYSRCDQWPSEPERASLLRIISETPINEETLLRIILIGITKDIPFTIPDTIDIITLVIKRASTIRITNYPAVKVIKFDIIDFLFSMTEYHHPENISLPLDYSPPKLAITVLYWKVWLIMLMISAHNASSFGAFCWDHYPTMKILIEMCITNQLNENNTAEEIQILGIEREHILEFEAYLAAQTSQAIITEENAILLSQLMLMDPMGPARKIPIVVIEQLRYLNKTLKLGHLLCRCRKPDLLLDIIHRQGTIQSMPWLSDLVQNSEGDFNHLPVQCLCEFLMFNAKNINEEISRDAELVSFLRNLVMNTNSNKQTVCEILDYIFRRLSSTVKQCRNAALEGVKLVFKSSLSDNENDWLLRSIPQMPFFKEVCSFIIPHLRSACQVENCPELVMSYIQFIAAHTLDASVAQMLDHVIDMAQLIVERSTMFQHIVPCAVENMISKANKETKNQFETLKCLFVMFNNYIIKLREQHDQYEWTEYPDLLMVQFEESTILPLHLNIIHAFIILLTQSTAAIAEAIPILNYWFPPERYVPLAYFPNLPEDPVQLLPDWLKLKMIRSSVDRLVESALHGLTPEQIVLFVQNFGTPVDSMSKLLALLDRAIVVQFDEVKDAILNKAYLAQLIEIQRARGAKNGHFTIEALDLHSHSQTVPDHPKLMNKVLQSINLKHFQRYSTVSYNISKANKETEEIFNMILKTSQLSTFNMYRFRMIIHQLLSRFGKSSKFQKDYQILISNKTYVYLMKIVDRFKIPNLYINVTQKRHICTFFRTLFVYDPTTKEDCSFMLHIINEVTKKISNRVETSNYPEYLYYELSLIKIFEYKNINFCENNSRFQKKMSMDELTLQEILSKLQYNKLNMKDFVIFCNSDICNNGLLVDWLSETDPELVMGSKTLQKTILYSKEFCNFRFYLLSLSWHQTNWKNMISTVNYLLQQTQLNMDCTTVLNIIESLINNPKLRKMYDKHFLRTKSGTTYDVHGNELYIFAQLVLKEGQTEMNIDSVNYDYMLCSRINLLFKLTQRMSCEIIKFVGYVMKISCSQALKMKVLQQIYIMFPSIKFINYNEVNIQTVKIQTLKGCEADKVANYLTTCLGNLILKKDFETLSSDVELLLRKLASTHPVLLLRQLGVLSSLLEGKTQMNVQSLREGYHFHRFIQILRALELLQPMLFDDTYKNEFHNLMSCYFTFLKQHLYVKDLYNVLIRFIELLQSYMNFNPSSALLLIEEHYNILMHLAMKFHTISQMQLLVQCIALHQCNTASSTGISSEEPKQVYEFEEHLESRFCGINEDADSTEIILNSPSGSIDINNRGCLNFVSPCNKTYFMSPHITNLIKIIQNSNAEDALLGPLQEIESLTSKRFTILTELFDRMLELIFSHNAQIRSNAFILLIRHLKQNPGRSDTNRCTLNAYIQCLRDDNSSVAATAVDNLTEIALLLQEYSVEILTVAFTVGIKSRLNTSVQIKRVLQTLHLQYGY